MFGRLNFLMHTRSDTMKPKQFWIVLMIPDFPLSQFCFYKLRQPTGQRLSNVRMQKKWIGSILFLCWLWGKWYHQIWIQTYLGFIVLILTLSPRLWGLSMHFNFHKFCVLIVWIVLLSWFDIRNSKLQFESLGKNCMESSCPNII